MPNQWLPNIVIRSYRFTIQLVEAASCFPLVTVHLSTAAVILDTAPVDSFIADGDNEIVDMASYMRCASGAFNLKFYNLAGRPPDTTLLCLFRRSLALGGNALRLPRLVSKSANEKEWQQLEEQLFHRWELLAAYSKNGDRKVYDLLLTHLRQD